jgi:hypothetical protein
VVLSTRKLRPRFLTIIGLAAVLTAVAGCGRVSVSGKATVGDKPLTTGSVTLVPDKDKGNTSTEEPVGLITETGTYEVYTNKQAGAPAGWYKVVVTAQEMPDNTKPMATKSLIDEKYTKAETTDLKIEVKSGAPAGTYDLKLSPYSGSGTTGPGRAPPMPK